jgi:hypothetical protein
MANDTPSAACDTRNLRQPFLDGKWTVRSSTCRRASRRWPRELAASCSAAQWQATQCSAVIGRPGPPSRRPP